MSNTFNIKRTETNGDGVALYSVAHPRPTSKIDVIIDALSVAQNSVWSALNQEALAYAVELKLELAKPEQEPVQFLLNGARYKVALQHHFGNSIVGLPEHLNGQWVALVDATDGKHLNYTAPPRKERELEQAIREERGRCHQLVWDYGFSKVGNNDVQEACATLAKRILAMGKK